MNNLAATHPLIAAAGLALPLLLTACAGHGKYTSAALENAQQRIGVIKASAEHDMALQAFLAGDLDKAAAGVSHALALNDQSAESFVLQGRVLLERGEIGEAIFALKQALTLSPDQPEIHFYLGMALERLRRTDEAILQYALAAELAPEDPQYTVAQAEALIDLGVLPDAKRLLEDSPAAVHSAGIKQLLGNVAMLESRPDDAIRHLREAALLASNDPAIQEDLSTAYLRAGRFAEAERQLAELLRRPSHADRRDLMQTRARCLIAISRPGEARTILRTLVAGDEGRSDAASWIALGETAFMIGDHADLRRAAARRCRHRPRGPRGLRPLGPLAPDKRQPRRRPARHRDRPVPGPIPLRRPPRPPDPLARPARQVRRSEHRARFRRRSASHGPEARLADRSTHPAARKALNRGAAVRALEPRDREPGRNRPPE